MTLNPNCPPLFCFITFKHPCLNFQNNLLDLLICYYLYSRTTVSLLM
uniref:Uncharacterized protein n=1 Tax=Arundo donax TaxID=35708 RepID=A0A0A9AB97_ARUDO